MNDLDYRAWDEKQKKMIQWEDEIDMTELYPYRLCDLPLKPISPAHSEFIYMPYTGVLDINGKKIYRGDILESREGYRFDVYFEDGAFKTESEDFEFINHQNVSYYQLRVVGNNKEHPHFLQ